VWLKTKKVWMVFKTTAPQKREGFTLPKTHCYNLTTAFGFFFVTMLGVDLSLLIGCGFRRPHCLSHCLASRVTLWDAL